MRRAAAKCLESVIATRHELLGEMYLTVSPALIARFKGIVHLVLMPTGAAVSTLIQISILSIYLPTDIGRKVLSILDMFVAIFGHRYSTELICSLDDFRKENNYLY